MSDNPIFTLFEGGCPDHAGSTWPCKSKPTRQSGVADFFQEVFIAAAEEHVTWEASDGWTLGEVEFVTDCDRTFTVAYNRHGDWNL